MEGWINKRVYIKTKSGREYTGIVLGIDKEVPKFLTILDKFNKKVMFALNEILILQEEAKQ